MYFNIRMIWVIFDMLIWEVGYEGWMNIELFWECCFVICRFENVFIYKGDSAEIYIEFLDILNNIDSVLRV